MELNHRNWNKTTENGFQEEKMKLNYRRQNSKSENGIK